MQAARRAERATFVGSSRFICRTAIGRDPTLCSLLAVAEPLPMRYHDRREH